MELNKYIDHTNLKAYATEEDIKKLCEEAKKYHFETVCVHPYYVKMAKKFLEDSVVGITTVVGFPLGANTKETKEYEAIDAINNGADEIDMVINLGALKNKDYDYIKTEIENIRDAIDGHTLKVIIETCYLEDDEIKKMTEICNETFVNFIKTSTGFGTRGASLHDLEIISENRNEILEIKASGGIKTEEDALDMIKAGATRIGTSNGVAIVTGKSCPHCEHKDSEKKECTCHHEGETHKCTCHHKEEKNEII